MVRLAPIGPVVDAAKGPPPLAFSTAGARGADVAIDRSSRFDPL
jgi:hypothetical protein